MYINFLKNLPVLAPYASSGKLQRGKNFVVLLMALLSFSLNTWAFSESISMPKIYSDDSTTPEGYNFPNGAHLKFTLRFFNYHEENAAYEDSVFLQVNGLDVACLNEVWKHISGNRDSESVLKGSDDLNAKVLGWKSFSKYGYSGVVALSKTVTEGESTKWVRIDVHVILKAGATNSWNKDIKLGVKGNWRYYTSKGKSTLVENAVVSTTFSPPSSSSLGWPTINSSSFTRTGNGKVKVSIIGLKSDTYPNSDGKKGTSGDWRYDFRFATRANNNNWPADNDLLKILDYKDDNTPTTSVNAYYRTTSVKTSKAEATLAIGNYKAYQIYPVFARYAPDYTVFPNDYSTAIKDEVFFYNYYTSNDVWINGYPRPNISSDNNAMSLEPDPWAKTMEISWYPQVSNSAHFDGNGSWIIFRDNTKIGTVSSTNSDVNNNTKKTFVDSTPDYGIKYKYTVVFQPANWTDAISSPTEVEDLLQVLQAVWRENRNSQEFLPQTSLMTGLRLPANSWHFQMQIPKNTN